MHILKTQSTGRRTPAQSAPIVNAPRLIDAHSDAIARNARLTGTPRTDLARMVRRPAPSALARILRAVGL